MFNNFKFQCRIFRVGKRSMRWNNVPTVPTLFSWSNATERSQHKKKENKKKKEKYLVGQKKKQKKPICWTTQELAYASFWLQNFLSLRKKNHTAEIPFDLKLNSIYCRDPSGAVWLNSCWITWYILLYRNERSIYLYIMLRVKLGVREILRLYAGRPRIY